MEETKKAGDVMPVATELKFVVISEDGKEIICATENEAYSISLLTKIWMKLNQK